MPSSLSWLALGASALLLARSLRSRGRGGRSPAARRAALASTGFEAYLLDESVRGAAAGVNGHAEPAAALSATSFEAYLRVAEARGTGAGTAPRVRRARQEVAADRVPVLVLYATEFGFSREVAEEVAAALKLSNRKFEPLVRDLGRLKKGWAGLAGARAAIFVSSTQGDGVPPSDARGFFRWLASDAAPELRGLSFAVAALGDRAYPRFAAAGGQLDARLGELGASRLAGRVDVHREDWPVLRVWISEVVAALEAAVVAGQLVDVEALGGPGAVADPEASAAAAGAESAAYGRSRPFNASVVAVERLCTEPSDPSSRAAFKQTVRVELDLGDSKLSYLPGDALGVWPENERPVVERVMRALGANGLERVPAPSWHSREVGADGKLSLADALAHAYDLKAVRPAFLRILLDAAGGEPAVEREGTPADTGDAPSLARLVENAEAAEAYVEHRWVADVLEDHPGSRPSLEAALGALRQLAPRLYSISSSPSEGGSRVQATVSIVRYETHGLPRGGVASTQLGERLGAGDRVPVFIHDNEEFRLPADPATPIIMVGPGTGIAPFRAFLVEREAAAEAAGRPCGSATLFFGCRRRDEDYLYRNQLEAWEAAGKLRLFTAFSREGPAKVYVQDLIEREGDELYRQIEAGAHLYICGDGGAMAPAVEKALARVLARGADLGEEEAVTRLEGMVEEGRLQRDVWVL